MEGRFLSVILTPSAKKAAPPAKPRDGQRAETEDGAGVAEAPQPAATGSTNES
jgi:hypothetical protein